MLLYSTINITTCLLSALLNSLINRLLTNTHRALSSNSYKAARLCTNPIYDYLGSCNNKHLSMSCHTMNHILSSKYKINIKIKESSILKHG